MWEEPAPCEWRHPWGGGPELGKEDAGQRKPVSQQHSSVVSALVTASNPALPSLYGGLTT